MSYANRSNKMAVRFRLSHNTVPFDHSNSAAYHLCRQIAQLGFWLSTIPLVSGFDLIVLESYVVGTLRCALTSFCGVVKR